jgi:ferredoxin
MRGVLEGLSLTLNHFFKPKVTQLYPYQKPNLPDRSRGLIQLIRGEGLEDRDFNLKCESCLLCEKACPPRAITIEYQPKHRFGQRDYFSPTSVAGFYTPRISEYAVDYRYKHIASVARTPTKVELEDPVDLSKVDAILAVASLEAYDLNALIEAVMEAYNGLPLAVAQRIVQVRGVDLSDIYGIATMNPRFKPIGPRRPGVLRQDQPLRGPSPSTRGVYGEINHRRVPSARV